MEVKSEQHTWNLCFTCRCQSEECMLIFNEATDSDSVTVVEVLTKYFWFQRDEFTDNQHVICESCWRRLDDFHQFYQQVEETHRRLNQELPKVCEGEKNCNTQLHNEVEVKVEDNWHHSEDVDSKKDCNTTSLEGEKKSEDMKDSASAEQAPQQRSSVQNVKQRNKTVNPDYPECDKDDDIIHTHMQYNCSICETNFQIFYQLKIHMQMVHSQKACVTCCGKRFYQKLALLEHVLILKDPNRFKCDICDKILINSSAVRKHKRETHATKKERKYRCNRCPQRFIRLPMLEYHMKKHTNFEKRLIKCTYCQKPFATIQAKNMHIKYRHESKSFVCDVCNKGFVTNLNLERHKDEHKMSPEELRAQCGVCHKWLKNKHTLKTHARLHSGPMECNICGRVLQHYQALAKHKISKHKPKLKYNCEECGSKFERAMELKKHALMHRRKKN